MKPATKKACTAKEARRKRLASLPIAEKVRILVRMQKMAAPLLKAQGREARVWKIGGEG
ncbi:hypothetical protein HQ587_03770 [bacterium]|nr:hypothetical protein [bacterium]